LANGNLPPGRERHFTLSQGKGNGLLTINFDLRKIKIHFHYWLCLQAGSLYLAIIGGQL